MTKAAQSADEEKPGEPGGELQWRVLGFFEAVQAV